MINEIIHKCVIAGCGKPRKGQLTCCEEHAGPSSLKKVHEETKGGQA